MVENSRGTKVFVFVYVVRHKSVERVTNKIKVKKKIGKIYPQNKSKEKKLEKFTHKIKVKKKIRNE